MISNGYKTEEYREIKDYYRKRFLEKDNTFKRFDIVEFTLGYPKKEDALKRMRFELKEIIIGLGKQEWGAEPNTEYFVLKLGERIY